MDKNKKLVDLENKLRQTKDKLGQPIDDGILTAIIALNVNKIPTFASCEGHLDHGESFPWVDIGNPEDRKLKALLRTADEYWKQANQSEIKHSNAKLTHQLLEKYHQTMALANRLSLEQARPIYEKLQSFYSKYNPPYGLRIIPTSIGPFVRIQPEDGVTQLLRNPEDKKRRLDQYRKEFSKFSNFLSKVV